MSLDRRLTKLERELPPPDRRDASNEWQVLTEDEIFEVLILFRELDLWYLLEQSFGDEIDSLRVQVERVIAQRNADAST